MFSKVEKSRLLWAEEIDALRRNAAAADDLSVVGAGLTVLGDVDCPGYLQVFGTVEGDVRARTLIVEIDGHIEGQVFAQKLVVGGSISGPVTATDIRIEATAKVMGNIMHNMLTVEPGAFIEGRRPWRPRPVTG